jgi:hypothetical protein
MPRICVFCGAPADSQEHVWPHWAAPMLANEGPLPHLHQISQEGRPDKVRRYSKDAYSVTVGVVCKTCNNGWMSTLESQAKPYLDPMLHGHGRALHATGIRTLAAWALKTSMMVEHMDGAKRRVIPSEEYAHLFENGEPSERVRIWMAAYTGTEATAVGGMRGLTRRRTKPALGSGSPTVACATSGAEPFSSGPSSSNSSERRSSHCSKPSKTCRTPNASGRTGGPSRGCPGRGSPTTN